MAIIAGGVVDQDGDWSERLADRGDRAPESADVAQISVLEMDPGLSRQAGQLLL